MRGGRWSVVRGPSRASGVPSTDTTSGGLDPYIDASGELDSRAVVARVRRRRMWSRWRAWSQVFSERFTLEIARERVAPSVMGHPSPAHNAPARRRVEHHGSESYFVLGEGLLTESAEGRNETQRRVALERGLPWLRTHPGRRPPRPRQQRYRCIATTPT